MTSSCTRDPELWFDDGNLVIQVTPRLFRLHRGVLALSSNFFRDMVAFPRAAEEDTYDDVPLVVLRDDDARDAAHFFKALYMPTYFPPPPARTTFEALEGVLRMAHKYDAPVLRRCALQHLARPFSSELCEVHLDMTRYYDLDLRSNWKVAELKAITSLAQEVHAIWLFPMVYHETLQHPANALDAPEVWLGRQRRFQHNEHVACFAGCEILRKEFPLDVFASTKIGCGQPVCLKYRLASINQDDMRNFMEIPLTYFTPWMENDDNFGDICDACMDAMRDAYNSWLKDVWQRLPSIFNLPDWDELSALKNKTWRVLLRLLWSRMR